MANVDVTAVNADAAGVAPSPVSMDAADTYFLRNNGKVLLHFLKVGAGVATITIVTQKTVGGYAVADQTVSIPATTGDKFVSLTARDIFNDASGDIEFSTDEDTGLTVDAIQLV